MDVLFINLAEQPERKKFLEGNFAANNDRGWRLHPIEACPAAAVTSYGVTGPLRDAEKACFLSHINAIATARQGDGHVFIAEDDILFGAKSFRMVESAIGSLAPDSWDILFTDVVIPDPYT